MYINEKGGGRTWARTKDPLIKSQLLYQLSYASAPYRRGAPIAAVCGASSPFLGIMSGRLHPLQERPIRPVRPQRSTAMIVPMQIMLVIIEEPPWLMKGRGMPTTGARPITIIRLMHT